MLKVGAGIALTTIGVLGIYNLTVPPLQRVGGVFNTPFMFFGPVALALGIAVLVEAIRRRPAAGAANRGVSLLRVGIVLLAIPVALTIVKMVVEDDLFGFLTTLSMIFFGLPGLVLAAIGFVRRRSEENRLG